MLWSPTYSLSSSTHSAFSFQWNYYLALVIFICTAVRQQFSPVRIVRFSQPWVRLFQEPYRTKCMSCIDIYGNIFVVPKCPRHMFAIETMLTAHGTLWIRQGLILLNVIATHLQTTRPLPGKITHIKMSCWRFGIWVHNIHFVKLVLHVLN